MRAIAAVPRYLRLISTIGLCFAGSASIVPSGHAQENLPSYSALTGQPVLTALPNQNLAQQTMAQSINQVCPTVTVTRPSPDLSMLCTAMIQNARVVEGLRPDPNLGTNTFGLDASGLNSALQQFNGGAELLVPTSQASTVQTTQTSRQTGSIEKRLKDLRNGTTTVASAESAGRLQIAALSEQGAGAQVLIAQNQAPALAYSIGPLGVFANGFGQFGSRDLTTSENGYSFNNAGFLAGADYRFTPQLIAGLAFGYSQSSVNFDTSAGSAPGQSLTGNLFQGNLYATYFVTQSLYVNAIGVIGGGNNNSRRRLVFGSTGSDSTTGLNTIALDRTATGTFGSRVAGATLATGYDLPLGPLVVTPIARFLYQHTGVDTFSEAGAMGADLQFGGSSINTVQSFLGADAQYRIDTSFGALYPIARFHWAHQYSPGNTAVSVAYRNDPSLLSSFILPSTPTSKNYFDLGVGMGVPLSPTSSAFVSFDTILGLNHTTYNSFAAGIRLIF